MATYRLTNYDRDGIVNRALVAAFADRRATNSAEENDLGVAVYEKLFSKADRDLALTMPEGWIYRDKCLRVTFGFQRTVLNLIDGVLVPSNNMYGCNNQGTIHDQDLCDRFTRLEQEKSKLKEDYDSAKNKLRALLNSVNTYARLAEVWPEGVEFYKSLEPKEGSKPLAIRTDEINAMLGLPLAA